MMYVSRPVALKWSPVVLALTLAACSQAPTTSSTSPQTFPALPGSPYDGLDHSWNDSDLHAQVAGPNGIIAAGSNDLSDLSWTSATNGWGPIEKDLSNGETAAQDGHTLTIGGTTYSKGLGVHADSSITYNLNGQCKTFTAFVGVDSEVGNRGSAGFQVYVDGKVKYDAVARGGEQPKLIAVDIAGAQQLKLVVNNGGDNYYYDHADWGNPVISVCSGTAPAPAPSPAPAPAPTNYSGPLVITKGGTYTGNWASTDADTPAVTVKTGDPVTIINSNLKGPGHMIQGWFMNLTVKNTRAYGQNPNIWGRAAGRFVEGDGAVNLDLENNYLEGTTGIYVVNFQGDPNKGHTIKILRNQLKNIDGRISDGNGGYNGSRSYVQFVQLNTVRNIPGIEIAWNQVVNEPYKSTLEENINMYSSGGTAASPISIHDNYIQGAYAINPASDSQYSGGGILLGDGSADDPNYVPGYANVYNNVIVSTSNQGIGVAGGHDYNVWGNRILSSGRLSDGSPIAAQNVGAYFWDATNGAARGAFYNNSLHDNVIGWTRINSDGGTWQNNTWLPSCSSNCYNNKDWGSAVTNATEAAEFQNWLARVKSNGLTLGVR